MKRDDPVPRLLLISNDVRYVVMFRTPLIRRAQAAGYIVHVVAPTGDAEDRDELAASGVQVHDWDLRKTGRNPFAELGGIAQLWRLIRALRPQIVFGYTIKPVIYGMLLARLARTPRRVALVTGLGYAFLPGRGAGRMLTKLVARLGYRFALRSAHVAIFQNADDLALFRRQGLLGRTAAGLVNGSGVDLADFHQAPPPSGCFTFLLVARLLRDKGVFEYIEAARAVRRAAPDTRFVIAGAADSNPAAVPAELVQGWVDEGLIEYLGYVRDPRPAYRDCHAFVLPSYREGTPRTNLEAMATGRPVITTDAPGCRETVVDGETGLLVPVRDATALADALLRLLRAPRRAAEMGQAGRRLCEARFELGKVTDATWRLVSGPPS